MTQQIIIKKVLWQEAFHYYCKLGAEYSAKMKPNETYGHTVNPDGTTSDEVCTRPFPDRFFCPECEKLELTEQEKEWMTKHVVEPLKNREEKMEKWNLKIQPIEDDIQYWERKREFLNTLLRSDKYILEKALKTHQPQPLPPEVQFYGKDCPKCNQVVLWAFIATSEVQVKPRKEYEKCPKCGLPGTSYTDNRGFTYYQHYIDGKRKVCYLGKT
jgi:hypothetical protein